MCFINVAQLYMYLEAFISSDQGYPLKPLPGNVRVHKRLLNLQIDLNFLFYLGSRGGVSDPQ